MTETRPEFHTALHQAGHAVAAHVLEVPFNYVSLEQDQGSLSYQLHSGNPASGGDTAAQERMATVSLAGRLAQEIYGGTVPADPLDPADQGLAANVAARHGAGADAYLDGATTQAREILTACWPAVKSVADLLITRERVSAKDVQTAIESACPSMAHPIRERADADTATDGAASVRRPKGAANSEDDAASIPEGALAGGVDEGGGD